MSDMDTLLSMKVFRQVVESGSFVAAAERLSLSKAMTSKHLMHLEKHLGARLLNRSSRSLSLTESGKLFFERCKGILEEVEEAELVAGSASGVPRGTLRVTAPSWAAADPPPATLIARPLRTMPFVIAGSREYLQRCGVPQSPEDLAQHDCLMIGKGHSWHLTGPNGNIDVPARVVLRFASSMSAAVAHAVCARIGLAPLPRLIFEDHMFTDALRTVLV